MAFRVETTETFEQDAEAVLDWLTSRHAGEAGLRWFLAMQEAVASLSRFPEAYQIAPENASFPFEVRQLLYGRKPHIYRVLFTIEGETVYVLHLRHGRRLPLTS